MSKARDIADLNVTILGTVEENADVTDATNVAAAGALIKSNNLSDLPDAGNARNNLGLGTAAVDSSVNLKSGRKNLIINGGMQVAQRGTTSTFGQSDKGYKTVDRWKTWEQGTPASTYSMDAVADGPDGFSSSHKLTCTTAETTPPTSVHMYTLQSVEGQDLQSAGFGTSSAKNLTISFWVKSSLTGTYAVSFKQYSSTAAVYYYGDTYTIDTANTWQKVSMVIPKNTAADITNTSSVGFSCDFLVVSGTYYSSGTRLSSWTVTPTAGDREAGHTANLGATVGNTWQITGVQLELGSVATDFEHRSYGEELALCQRYFQHSGKDITVPNLDASPPSTGTCTLGVDNEDGMVMAGQFPVRMRSAPTISYGRAYSYNWGTYRTVANLYGNANGLYRGTHDGGYSIGRPYWVTWTADAEL